MSHPFATSSEALERRVRLLLAQDLAAHRLHLQAEGLFSGVPLAVMNEDELDILARNAVHLRDWRLAQKRWQGLLRRSPGHLLAKDAISWLAPKVRRNPVLAEMIAILASHRLRFYLTCLFCTLAGVALGIAVGMQWSESRTQAKLYPTQSTESLSTPKALNTPSK